MFSWKQIKLILIAVGTLGLSILYARHNAAKVKQGEDGEKLKQYEQASSVQAKNRMLQDDANKIAETISRRDRANRSGLLHYAAADSEGRNAGKENNSDA